MEDLYNGIKNSTDESAKKLGHLAVLHSAGAIDTFAMIAKNYPEILIALQAYEQTQFLNDMDLSARDFFMFKKGQASVAKYATDSLKYILSVDATKET